MLRGSPVELFERVVATGTERCNRADHSTGAVPRGYGALADELLRHPGAEQVLDWYNYLDSVEIYHMYISGWSVLSRGCSIFGWQFEPDVELATGVRTIRISHPHVWPRSRIVFADTPSGGICVDLEPGPGGVAGQIVRFGDWGTFQVVVAESLYDFFGANGFSARSGPDEFGRVSADFWLEENSSNVTPASTVQKT